MSGYLLDTNVPSEIIRQRANVKVDFWVRSQDDETLFLSAITIGELRKGLAIQPEGKRRDPIEEWLEADLIPAFTDRILPVTRAIAERWGVLSGMRQMRGRPLVMAYGLIAATALEHDLIVVTRNVRDFEDLGLKIVNPWAEI